MRRRCRAAAPGRPLAAGGPAAVGGPTSPSLIATGGFSGALSVNGSGVVVAAVLHQPVRAVVHRLERRLDILLAVDEVGTLLAHERLDSVRLRDLHEVGDREREGLVETRQELLVLVALEDRSARRLPARGHDGVADRWIGVVARIEE